MEEVVLYLTVVDPISSGAGLTDPSCGAGMTRLGSGAGLSFGAGDGFGAGLEPSTNA